MSLHRFYIDPAHWSADNLALSGAEAHHCIDVLRCKDGDRVIAFNGQGIEATAEIVSSARDRVTLRSIGISKCEPLAVRITLGQAIPKKKNMDFIVQKATELGAHRIVPLLSERTVVRLDAEERAARQAKWQRVALEASKQSGQNWLPEIALPLTPQEFLKSFSADSGATLMLIASLQPDAVHFREVLREHSEVHGRKPDQALVLIGPEGDFTPAETALARSTGCIPFTLGPIVLRTETAALYSLSILGYELF